MSRQIIILLIIIITNFSCEKNRDTNNSQADFCLYESYNLLDIYPAFLEADEVLRMEELDSLSKIESGIALYDKMITEEAKSDTLDGKSWDGFHFFEVFTPNITSQYEWKSSAILGMTQDTATLIKYLLKTDTCFSDDIEWKIVLGLNSGHNSLHAIKKHKEKIILTSQDIDSVIVIPAGLNSVGGVIEEISDLCGISEYLILMKLKKDLISKLSDKTFSLITNINSKEFSSSVSDFSSTYNKYIMIGQMDNSDFEILRNKFEAIMKISKGLPENSNSLNPIDLRTRINDLRF